MQQINAWGDRQLGYLFFFAVEAHQNLVMRKEA